MLDPALNVTLSESVLSFRYGSGTAGPQPEFRSLDAIRSSLLDPRCSGPDPVYGIAMDVARTQDLDDLKRRMLLWHRRLRSRTPRSGATAQPGPRACHRASQRLVLTRGVSDPARAGDRLCAAMYRG